SGQNNDNTQNNNVVVDDGFTGNKGERVLFKNKQIELDANQFNKGDVNFFNTEINNKNVYFFVVKDENGVYRAAGNACQVCHDSKLGFTQQGDYMVCNTCGTKYPLEKIATEKGGCNPIPINPNLKTSNGNIIISEDDIKQIVNYF
ncbi:Fe-S-containing protein, partial [Patescibacteria group bacterium]